MIRFNSIRLDRYVNLPEDDKMDNKPFFFPNILQTTKQEASHVFHHFEKAMMHVR